MVAIVGPTAVGKSQLGLRLAELLDGEIVNADALQAYRGFDIGTAKTTLEERQHVQHHLIDILDPHDTYSAGEFSRRAREVVDDILVRRRLPILVGGSGLYLRAFLDGMSPIPPTRPEMRRYLRRRLASEGLARLRLELGVLDPETEKRLEGGDSQRILRALEVSLSTGRPLSSWITEQPFGAVRSSAVRIGLTLPRSILYDRIAERVRSMIRKGWVEEVEELLGRGLSPSLPAFQAIGYRQLACHVSGEGSLEATLDEIIRATRRFAKRQQTWYRKDTEITWFDVKDPMRTLADVRTHLDQVMKRGTNGQSEH